MCVAVPMKLREVKSAETGTVEMEGVVCEVNLSLIDNPVAGDYVIVHAGYAIERLDQAEAEDRIALLRQLALGGGAE